MAFSIVQSLLTIARDGGDLPKWPLANVYVPNSLRLYVSSVEWS
jgi:hypothetical protein